MNNTLPNNWFVRLITYKPSYSARIVWGILGILGSIAACAAVGLSDLVRTSDHRIHDLHVAQRAGATLVTTDRQQLERLDGAVSVMSPGQALSRSADPRVAADLAMRALRGRGRGERPVERLLEERQKDRDREA